MRNSWRNPKKNSLCNSCKKTQKKFSKQYMIGNRNMYILKEEQLKIKHSCWNFSRNFHKDLFSAIIPWKFRYIPWGLNQYGRRLNLETLSNQYRFYHISTASDDSKIWTKLSVKLLPSASSSDVFSILQEILSYNFIEVSFIASSTGLSKIPQFMSCDFHKHFRQFRRTWRDSQRCSEHLRCVKGAL